MQIYLHYFKGCTVKDIISFNSWDIKQAVQDSKEIWTSFASRTQTGHWMVLSSSVTSYMYVGCGKYFLGVAGALHYLAIRHRYD